MTNLLNFVEGNTFFWQWEVDLMAYLQQGNNQFLISLWSFMSMFGEELIMVGILGFIYWSLDKKFGEYVGFNILAVNVLNPMIKNIANRRRPYFDSDRIDCLKLIDSSADKYDIVAQGFSFPSGHSSGAAAVYPSLAVYKKKNWLVAIAIAIPLLVGFSRVYLGVHYPTDVLAGWALGIGVVFLMTTLRKVVKNKYWIYLTTIIIGCAGIFYCKTNDYFTSLGMLIGFTLGILFDEKVVKFQNTKVWWRMILRVVLGGGVYLALNAILKLPMKLIMGSEWLETVSVGNFAFRTVRYAIIAWFVIGVYPICFKWFDKLWTKLGWIKQTENSTEEKQDKSSEASQIA